MMEEILHQLIGSLSHYLQGFIHPSGAGFLHQQYEYIPKLQKHKQSSDSWKADLAKIVTEAACQAR